MACLGLDFSRLVCRELVMRCFVFVRAFPFVVAVVFAFVFAFMLSCNGPVKACLSLAFM